MVWRGKLLEGKYDSMFKHLAADETGIYFGNVDSPVGAVTGLSIGWAGDTELAFRLISVGWVPETQAELDLVQEIKEGWYAVIQDSNGIIWVFYYSDEFEYMSDLNSARNEFHEWEDQDDPEELASDAVPVILSPARSTTIKPGETVSEATERLLGEPPC
jgi:hypothetical protein